MLTAGSTAEVAVHQQQAGPLVLRAIEGMGPRRPRGQLDAVIGEGRRAQRIEGDALEEAGRDDPIGIDVVAAHHHRGAADRINRAEGERGAGHGIRR